MHQLQFAFVLQFVFVHLHQFVFVHLHLFVFVHLHLFAPVHLFELVLLHEFEHAVQHLFDPVLQLVLISDHALEAVAEVLANADFSQLLYIYLVKRDAATRPFFVWLFATIYFSDQLIDSDSIFF